MGTVFEVGAFVTPLPKADNVFIQWAGNPLSILPKAQTDPNFSSYICSCKAEAPGFANMLLSICP